MIGVLVADDHAILRAGLRMLVNDQADRAVCWAPVFVEAVGCITHHIRPVIDFAMHNYRSGGVGVGIDHEILTAANLTFPPFFLARVPNGAAN